MTTSYEDALQDPEVMASRLRLYTVVGAPDLSSYRLKNAEGLTFTAPANDIQLIGNFDSTAEVTQTEMAEKLEHVSGWFHISFIKADKSIRHMYAHVHGKSTGGLMPLQDLTKPNSETRNCRMERVVSVITKNKRYVVTKAAYRKLTK